MASFPYNSVSLKDFRLIKDDEANVESSEDDNFNPLYVNGKSKNASKLINYNSKKIKTNKIITNAKHTTQGSPLFLKYNKNMKSNQMPNNCSTKTSFNISSCNKLNKTISSKEMKNSNSFIITYLDNNLVDMASKIANKKELNCLFQKLKYESEEENLKLKLLLNEIKGLKFENVDLRKKNEELANENYNLMSEFELITEKLKFQKLKEEEKVSNLKNKLNDDSTKLKMLIEKNEKKRIDMKNEACLIKKKKAQLENDFVIEYEAVNLCKREKYNLDIKDMNKNQSIKERSNIINSLINNEDVTIFSVPISKELKTIITKPDAKKEISAQKTFKKNFSDLKI